MSTFFPKTVCHILIDVPYIDRCKLMVKCVQSADKEMLITVIQLLDARLSSVCWSGSWL